MMSSLEGKLSHLGLTLQRDVPLKNFTTLKVGGPAKYFVSVENTEQLLSLLKLLHEYNEPFFILGKGSNLVISDKGIDAFVILNNCSNFRITEAPSNLPEIKKIAPRFENYFNYNNSPKEYRSVIADSGIRLQYLMNKLFEKNIVGLEFFNGIPCTLGGAIYMNLHGGNKFISDYVYSAKLFSDGKIKEVTNSYFKFDYDYSILHETKETIIEAELILPVGDGALAKKEAANWAKRKSVQPKDSAGCIFKNLSTEQMKMLNIETTSTGYVIDKLLELRGKQIGGARISPSHAAFIENIDNATAKDVFDLYSLIKSRAKEKLKLDLEPEVEFIGEF